MGHLIKSPLKCESDSLGSLILVSPGLFSPGPASSIRSTGSPIVGVAGVTVQ